MKRVWPLLIPIAVAIFFSYPFFRSGYFATDDGQWAIVRLAEMKRELRDFQTPPRWAGFLNHGYGYPLFSFTYPLPYYMGAVLSYTGLGLTTTIKILFVLSVIVSAVGMFFLGRELAGTGAGVIASVFYVVAPFRLTDLYQRGSLGESLSMALFPLLCLTGLSYILKPSVARLVMTAGALAMMLTMHNALALLFLPWWGLFLLVMVASYSERVPWYLFRYLLPMLLLGGGLACYFVVPALVEKRYIALSVTPLANPAEHFVTWQDYLFSPWYQQGNRLFALGIAQIAAVALSLLTYVFSGSLERKKHQRLVVFLIIFFLIGYFLTTADSVYLWNNTLLSAVDFPWRLLPVIIFFLSLGTVFLNLFLLTRIVAGGLLVAAVILNSSFIAPQQALSQPDTYYLTNDATTTSADELLPIWVKEKPTNRTDQSIFITGGQATVSAARANSFHFTLTVAATTPVAVQVPQIYYPGWQVTDNGQPVVITHDNPQGLIAFSLPTGTHVLSGTFTETPLRRLADSISLISLGLSAVLLVWAGIQSVRGRRTVPASLTGALVEDGI